jgi:hypothetical protein
LSYAHADDENEAITESNLHSFIIRVWFEEAPAGTCPPVWRGHIRHIPGGELRYFTNLNDITEFIRTHLHFQR